MIRAPRDLSDAEAIDMLDRWTASHARMVAQLGWLYDREAAALARANKETERLATRRPITGEELAAYDARQAETLRLRRIACEFDAATVRAGYVGYAFGEEAT